MEEVTANYRILHWDGGSPLTARIRTPMPIVDPNGTIYVHLAGLLSKSCADVVEEASEAMEHVANPRSIITSKKVAGRIPSDQCWYILGVWYVPAHHRSSEPHKTPRRPRMLQAHRNQVPIIQGLNGAMVRISGCANCRAQLQHL